MRLGLWMAYVLSKLLPLAVLPLGLSLILLVVGLIGRWRWPVISALLLIWLFPLGLVSQGLWRWLEAPCSVVQQRSRRGLTQSSCLVAVVIRPPVLLV